MKNLAVTLTFLFAVLFMTMPSVAQEVYTFASNTELKVSGTSSIHDWDMISGKANGKGVFTINDGKLVEINSIRMTVPVKSLKSGKSQMDANAYKALKEDKYQDIVIELVDVEKISGQIVTAKFKFTIAGTTRIVKIDAKYSALKDSVSFSGKLGIKFTDYNIEPPTAVFGTIKTGNDLVLSFNVLMKTIDSGKTSQK